MFVSLCDMLPITSPPPPPLVAVAQSGFSIQCVNEQPVAWDKTSDNNLRTLRKIPFAKDLFGSL